MRGFHQAYQLVGRDYRHVPARAATHDNDFPIIDRAIHERLELRAAYLIGENDAGERKTLS